MEMMCFVVVYTHGNRYGNIAYQGMQIDDGESAYQYAKAKGYDIRKWEMYGLSHLHELDTETRKEIKEFIRGLH